MIRLSLREFNRLARREYRQLPLSMRQAIQNLEIAVAEWPGPEELDLLDGEETLFGLYRGVPLPEREGAPPLLPDQITLYRQPILRSCATRAEVEREIRITLWHEVGHYLGLSEEDLHRLGYG